MADAPQATAVNRKSRVGTVVSDRNDKTIVVSIERATNPAPQPIAKLPTPTGLSMEPAGVEGDFVPRRDVGEYCPLVRP